MPGSGVDDSGAGEAVEAGATDPFAMEVPVGSPLQAIETVAPVAGFLLVNSFAHRILGTNEADNIKYAIATITVLSLLSLGRRKRNGLPIGKFLPLVTLAIIVRGILGIRYGEDIYFQLGIASKFGISIALAATVAFRQLGGNAVGRLAPYAFGFGPAVTSHESYVKATRVITLAGAVYYAASAVFDVWLLQRSTVNEYVLWRSGVNMVVSMTLASGAMVYLARKLQAIDGFPGLVQLLEDRVEQQAAAWGWDLSETGPAEQQP